MKEEPEQARVPQLVLLVGVVGQHEALGHPDDAGARPQQDSGAVEDDGGGVEELETVEDVEGGSQHEAGGGAGEDEERGSCPGEESHDAVDYGQTEDSSVAVLEAGQGVEASEKQHEANSEHANIEQSGRVRHPSLTEGSPAPSTDLTLYEGWGLLLSPHSNDLDITLHIQYYTTGSLFVISVGRNENISIEYKYLDIPYYNQLC